MTREEKIRLIEETFELGENTLNENTSLEDIRGYDSMAKLTLIVLCDDEFNKKLTGEQITKFRSIKDILDFIG
jgi:acyl carrier protein